MVENPRELLPGIRNAGAVFLGMYTPEALGDYLAGPNHVLPTGGTARFASPLGVYDFVKRTSILSFSREALERYGSQTARFAEMEGLGGHGNSVLVRLEHEKDLDKIALLIKMSLHFRRGHHGPSVLPSGRNSAVECQLPKLDVVGSSPIARSK